MKINLVRAPRVARVVLQRALGVLTTERRRLQFSAEFFSPEALTRLLRILQIRNPLEVQLRLRFLF